MSRAKTKARKRAAKPEAEEEKVTPQIIRRPIVRCEKCDAVNSFRQVEGIRELAAFGQASAKCTRCGHRAKIRIDKDCP